MKGKGLFKGIRGKLLKSQILNISLSLIFFTSLLAAFSVINFNVQKLIKQDIPLLQATENIQTGLQKSFAAIRGWLSVNDDAFILERKFAWTTEIDPNIRYLERFIQKINQPKLLEDYENLVLMLRDLKVWQWRIEDIGQSPGNYSDTLFIEKNLTPASNHILSILSAMIHDAKTVRSSVSKSEFYELISLRNQFNQLLRTLHQYVYTGQKGLVSQLRLHFLGFRKSLDDLSNKRSAFSLAQSKKLNVLVIKVKNYEEMLDKLYMMSHGKYNGLAAEWLENKALPLARSSNNLLEKMIGYVEEIQQNTADELKRLNMLFYYLILASIGLLCVLSFGLALSNSKKLLNPIALLLEATKRLAEGGESKAIPISLDDELGELTASFNKMHVLRQQAEEKIRCIIDTAIDPIITINPKGIIQTCNTACIKLFGYEKEELIGENITILMPEPYRSEHDMYLKKYLKTKIKKMIGSARELETITKKGEVIPVRLAVSEIKINDEHLFAGILHDIRIEKLQTDKLKRMNEQLQKENLEKVVISKLEDSLRKKEDIYVLARATLNYFADFFSSYISVFYLHDPKTERLTMIEGYGFKERRCRTTHLERGETLVGECIRNNRILEINDVPEDYIKVSSGVGETVPSQIIILPLAFEETVLGAIELCVLSKLSSTQKKLLTEAVKIIAIYLSTLISRLRTQELLNETEKQKQSLARQEEELRASNEELESQSESLKQSEEELRSTNKELQIQLDTIEKQKETLSKTSEELKKSSQYKSEFIANMSHELRTPLNSLLILAQSFMKNKEGNLSNDQVKEAKIIYEAGVDLLTLINDILDVSKIEAGKLRIENREVVLSDVIDTLERQFAGLAKERKNEFIVECDKHVPEKLFIDDVRLQQILKNLLSNAIKFTTKGRVTLRVFEKSSMLHFEVSDTGIGIDKDKQDLIFSEFQQEDGSTSRKYGGTGLGLSISKKLAAMMHGTIQLESEKGKGSRFTFILPIESSKSNKFKAPEPISTSGEVNEYKQIIEIPEVLTDIPVEIPDDRNSLDSTKQTILLIDDDKTFNESLVKLIKESAFNVISALTGKTGLALAVSYQPNGIILDLGLTDIQGDDVLSQLKSDDRTKNIPVHIISATDKANDVINQGALSFFQKPVGRDEVNQILSTIAEFQVTDVLILESDTQALDDLKEALVSFSDISKIESVKTSDELYKKLEDNNYYCIILDFDTLAPNGFKTIETIVHKMNIATPIIVYTEQALNPDEFKAISAYTDKIIVKGDEAIERLKDEVALFIHHIKKGYKGHSEMDVKYISKYDFKGKKVLVVDDDLRNTFSLSHLLQSEGFKVLIADNGELAIQKLDSEKGIDIILMDMMMPVMDGFDTIKKIKEVEAFKHIPIISVTAQATSTDRKKCIDVGANDYLSKPVDVARLLELIKFWLSSRGVDA